MGGHRGMMDKTMLNCAAVLRGQNIAKLSSPIYMGIVMRGILLLFSDFSKIC
jgi:hypothetical protein